MFRPLAVLALVTLVASLAAEDKKPADKDKEKPAISGIWTREANGLDLKFDFTEKDILKITVSANENGAIVTCKYTVDKDGVVKAKITDVEEKGKFVAKPPKGLEFSFKWKRLKDGNAELVDLKGEGLEEAKPVLEGEFVAKKK